MVRLADTDVNTREVLAWKGIHVLHHPISSCSQKLRIFLNLKGIEWQSHIVDLQDRQNLSSWYLGINLRGLVPTLVHDGAVHIESNDILIYLERIHPEPRLIPVGMENQLTQLLRHEDDLHLDLRTLSFKFVFASADPPKSEEDLRRYATAGSGTVQGRRDAAKDVQIAFWQQFITGGGISDDIARKSVERFRTEFSTLEDGLSDRQYLFGAGLTVLDIAWFIYVNRLLLAGYPMMRLHPRLGEWFQWMNRRPEFAREVMLPEPAARHFAALRKAHALAGSTLEQITGL